MKKCKLHYFKPPRKTDAWYDQEKFIKRWCSILDQIWAYIFLCVLLESTWHYMQVWMTGWRYLIFRHVYTTRSLAVDFSIYTNLYIYFKVWAYVVVFVFCFFVEKQQFQLFNDTTAFKFSLPPLSICGFTTLSGGLLYIWTRFSSNFS